MLYSLYILKQGADNKSRKREVGIATTNKDGSLTLHFDVAIPLTADNQQAKVFMREIVRTEQSTPEVTEAVA
jgi:hypothetical protein|tara:strand:- start:3889 stop:4104 length:216 start_codon:yes stop_codon:yes gene_type:complete